MGGTSPFSNEELFGAFWSFWTVQLKRLQLFSFVHQPLFKMFTTLRPWPPRPFHPSGTLPSSQIRSLAIYEPKVRSLPRAYLEAAS